MAHLLQHKCYIHRVFLFENDRKFKFPLPQFFNVHQQHLLFDTRTNLFFSFSFFNQSITETEEYDGGRAFRNLELIRSLFEVLNYEQQFSRVLEMPFVTFL